MPLSLDELNSHLFKCADIIRDAIDPTDYKEYILPLVYYKTISDEFENQYQDNIDEYGKQIARDPDLYDVPVVPEGHTWDDICAITDNVDKALNEAFEALIKKNPELEGAFRVDFVNANGLNDDRLTELMDHLNKYDFDRTSIPPDLLGDAFRDLIHHFAEEEGKRGGQFYTPPEISKLSIALLNDFEDGDEFHDPTVGSAGMLVDAARYYREEQDKDPSELRLTGQEINLDIAAIARLNLSIHDLNDEIARGDSLLDPQFTQNGELERFDYVVSNFPFSMDWPKDELRNDQYERFNWSDKLPRADRGDYAFIMHIAKHLKRPNLDGTGGKAAIIIPHGVLFRKHEMAYRKYMLEHDLVEAIIGLPEKLFPNTAIPSAILVLNTDKPTEKEGEVQFIHAADPDFYEERKSQNKLTEDGIDRIVSLVQDNATRYSISKTAQIEEIRENDYNLNITFYVDGVDFREGQALNRGLSKLDEVSYDGQLNLKANSTFDAILGRVIQKLDNTVLVLGNYEGAHKAELVRVKRALEERGYEAHLFEDLPDFPGQDLSGSVATAMRLVGFCVMVDRQASGHIDEYRLAEKQRTILARLVSNEGGSTRMIGGSEHVDVNYIKTFEFGLYPQEVLDEAVDWADQMQEKREQVYSDLYEWRD
ncbi:type I restriction-modification system subunit M [Natrarchaeobius oligotrophus]|uniref:site-specific DNA-methyltransferase (adenine-specific) n=1 Tax=Natrarchaeobius chitinivorans TaxID=1679083 RepID=A0A3N6MC55_NATCH|nr:class I SAM-dependent DNA methyltransferase [Natrarchaeobius chitinivorans]RQG98294.1 SAM-dependent DNA methyltransferase [Natrarchaeobius chitinivorans]